MLQLKKGDKVVYLGNMPYKLSNEQEVFKEGDELLIQSNVSVQKKFFSIVDEPKIEKKVVEEKKPEPKKIQKQNKK